MTDKLTPKRVVRRTGTYTPSTQPADSMVVPLSKYSATHFSALETGADFSGISTGGDSFTVAFWIRLPAVNNGANSQDIVTNRNLGDSGSRRWGIRYRTEDEFFQTFFDDGATSARNDWGSIPALVPGQSYHVVFGYDFEANQVNAWVNNTYYGARDFPLDPPFSNTFNILGVGHFPGASSTRLNADLQGLLIDDKLWNADEVKQDYLAGKYGVSYTEDDKTFITTWQTTTAAESITLPLISSGTYDFEVDWGDGSTDTITAFDDAARIHEYAEAGVRDVRISGVCEGWNLNDVSTSSDNILDVKNWGIFAFGSSAVDAFRACSNLDITAADAPNMSGVNSIRETFRQSALVGGPGFNGWDVSGVTGNGFQSTFLAAPSFNSDIGAWDVSNAGTLIATLRGASAFNQDISGWDVSGITSFSQLFRDASSFNQDISGWDVSNASNIFETFLRAAAFNQNLGPWNLRRAGVDMTNALSDSGLSPENYSRTLIGWANYVASSPGGPFDVPLGAGTLTYNDTVYEPGSTYTNAVDARAYLTGLTGEGGAGWTITDGGLAT